MIEDPTSIIIGCATVGIIWALVQFLIISKTSIEGAGYYGADEERTGLKNENRTTPTAKELRLLKETYEAISTGAEAFLRAEYTICAYL